MDYKESYRKKMTRIGTNHYDRTMKIKSREFYQYFNNTLNKEECEIDGKRVFAVFQDHSQSNNKDLSDDKYVILPNETKADVGNYIFWRGTEWLIFTEEFKTIATHQQLKIKITNEKLKWIKNKKISNGGEGWGAYVQNQTLYTLGVSSSGNHISVVNAKMMMYMQNNEETAALKIQDRIFIGSNVYKIMFMDTVSRKGLINFLLEEDTISSYDNLDLRIADYYKTEITVPGEEKPPVNTAEIIGEKLPKMSKTYVYKISEGSTVKSWLVESIDGVEPGCHVMERTDKTITLKMKDDQRVVGTTITVIAEVTNGDFVSLPLRIVNRF